MIPFQKFQGTGNDFIIFKASDLNGINYNELARNVCNRNFGIGADGMILVDESSITDIKMDFFNGDGTIATMCGNGIRCFSKFVYENGIVNKTKFEVETLAGIMKIEVNEEFEQVSSVKVNLGKPVFSSNEIPKSAEEGKYINKEISINNEKFYISSLIIGTIHTVLFVEEFDDIKLARIGKLIENHEIFPMKTNVNFCKVIDKENIEVLTWEKGVGLTLACGTGAAACFIISEIVYNCNKKANIRVKAGNLFFEDISGDIFMTGSAEFICKGEYNFTLYKTQ